MRTMRAGIRRLLGLFRRRRWEREMDEELASHLQLHIDDNIRAGMSPEEARRQALIKLGGVEPTKEAYRDQHGVPLVETLIQDIRYSLRALRRNPGFAAVAILTLGLGIGANSAVFSLLEAVALRELPVPDPEQLVLLHWTKQKPPEWYAYYDNGGCDSQKSGPESGGCSFASPALEQFRSRTRTLSGLFAFAPGPGDYVPAGTGEKLTQGQLASGEFFSTLGVGAFLGRTLEPRDDLPGAQPVAFLSHAFWKSQYGADPGVLGKTISLTGTSFTIVGVAPAKFTGLQPGSMPDFWIPLHSPRPGRWNSMDDRTAWLNVIGRLKPGVSAEEARAELEVLFRQSLTPGARQASGTDTQPGIALTSAARGMHALRLRYLPTLEVLAAGAGLLLLIACANLASLLMARTRARQRELAARLAVGAGRRRLARQLLTESLVLMALGCVVGLIVAWESSHWMAAFMSSGTGTPTLIDVRLNWSLFGFTAAVSGFAVVLFGLAPALAGTRVEPAAVLKAAAGQIGPSALSGRRRGRFGPTLIAIETALALVLLVGAGLLLRTLFNLQTLDPGFRRDHLLTVQTALRPEAGRVPAEVYPDLQSRLAALPGAVSVTWSGGLLLVGEGGRTSLDIEGRTGPPPMVHQMLIGPRFFETLGISILAGRNIRPEDHQNPKVAWVNRALARRYFPGGNPVHRRLQSGYYEIAGVVSDTKYASLRDEIEPGIFIPSSIGQSFILRTASNPMSFESAVRRTFREAAPGLRILRVSSLSERIDENLFNERMLARLSTVFGSLALLLAAIGVYGVVAYSVARRTREIAIRVSLGATPQDVVRLVAAEGLLPAAAGAIR